MKPVKKVLVTGGFGYLGARLSISLSRIGKEVVLGSRSNRTSPDWLDGAKTVQTRFDSVKELKPVVSDVDAIVHLAGANEVFSQNTPAQALIDTAVSTLNLVQACSELGGKRFVYGSTIHVYGNRQNKITEQSPARPIHPYALCHKAAEDYVLAAHDKGDIQGVVLRLSNGFGAPVHTEIDRWKLLVNELCLQAFRKRRLRLRTPAQTRDFIPIADVCRAVDHFIDLPPDQLQDGVFHLASGRNMSVDKMAELVSQRSEHLFGIKPAIEKACGGASSASKEFCTEKLEKTGFVPSLDFTKEIDDTLKFIEKFSNEIRYDC